MAMLHTSYRSNESKRFAPALAGRIALIAIAIGTALIGGCATKDPTNPGTEIGTFHVSAKLTQTTCGSAPDPWEFDVKLNHDGTVLYWIQGGDPIQGQVNTVSADTVLRTSNDYTVTPADPKNNKLVCAMTRTDVLDITLATVNAAPATDPTLMSSFAGDLIYTFTPTSDSDCSAQVVDSGGAFDTLPCLVSYSISGVFSSTTTPTPAATTTY